MKFIAGFIVGCSMGFLVVAICTASAFEERIAEARKSIRKEFRAVL